MPTALIVLAAAEHGPSKTPFYVAGGLLCVFAIAVSALGIIRPESFPPTKGARAALSLLCGLLVAAVMATAVITG
jgi:hypothetical protein